MFFFGGDWLKETAGGSESIRLSCLYLEGLSLHSQSRGNNSQSRMSNVDVKFFVVAAAQGAQHHSARPFFFLSFFFNWPTVTPQASLVFQLESSSLSV